MWALLVCVLVKPVEIANGLDLQHGTSAECLDVATDGKGGRPSTFVVEVKRTSSCPNCGGANHSGETSFPMYVLPPLGVVLQLDRFPTHEDV